MGYRDSDSNTGTTPIRVLVAGGRGFIGRHAVAALRRAGAEAIVGTRQRGPTAALTEPRRFMPAAAMFAPPGFKAATSHAADRIETRRLRFENLMDADAWRGLIADVDVVLNVVGILRPVGNATFDRVHHRAVAALARAAAAAGKRIVHVSALGLDHPHRSAFLTSKRDGERALIASGGDWWLVRPSLLDGEGGYGARWLRRVAQWPVNFLPQRATGRIAPLDVRDLGDVLARLCLALQSNCVVDSERIVEVGGPDVRSFAAHLAALRNAAHRRRVPLVGVPHGFARMTAHVCDALHATPFSFGHYELMQFDNLPRHNRLPLLLGRAPRRVIAR